MVHVNHNGTNRSAGCFAGRPKCSNTSEPMLNEKASSNKAKKTLDDRLPERFVK